MLKLKEIQKLHPFMFVGLEPSDNRRDINSVIHAVVKATGIEFTKIQSPSRNRNVVDARHYFCYFAKKKSRLSLQAIGDIINRDHATVIHAIKKVNNLIETDRDAKELVPKIFNLISQHERMESNKR